MGTDNYIFVYNINISECIIKYYHMGVYTGIMYVWSIYLSVLSIIITLEYTLVSCMYGVYI